MKKIPDAIFRYIEHELYNHKDSKKDLAELQREKVVETSSTYSPEENTLTTKGILRATRTIRDIEKAKKRLNECELQLFHLKYDRERTWQQIVIELNISESTYFRWRKKIVRLVAERMGFLTF